MTASVKKNNKRDGKPCAIKNRENHIDNYLTGKLSVTEMEAFEQHMITCPACLDEMAFRKEVIEMVKDEGAEIFANDASQADSDVAHKMHPVKRPKKLRITSARRWAYGFLVAVSFAVIIIVVTRITNKPSPVFYTFEEEVPYPFEPAFLIADAERSQEQLNNSAPAAFKAKFVDVMAIYQRREYNATIEALNTLEAELSELRTAHPQQMLPVTREFYFYRGISNLAQYNLTGPNDCLKGAVEDLQKAQSFALENQLSRRDRDTYFLALALKFNGSEQQAKHELEKIRAEDEFGKRAEVLLKTIHEISSK